MPISNSGEPESLPPEVDVIVVGSSAAALTGALTAALGGLSVVVLEKTEFVGGTAAYSGAGLWLPGNRVLRRAGIDDSIEKGLTYFRATVGDRTPRALQDAYVHTGPELVEFLEDEAKFRLEYMEFPDYFEAPGRAKPTGRAINPSPILGAELGDLLEILRPTAGRDKFDRDVPREVLTGGQSLVGQLLLAIERVGRVDIRRSTPFESLIVEDGDVVGVLANGAEVRARRGVLLALGGYDADDARRQELHGLAHGQYSAAPTGVNTGDALAPLEDAGAAFDLLDEAWWCPAIIFSNGYASFLPIVRGGIFIGPDGKRFVDEGLPYDRLGHELLDQLHQRGAESEFWWVFDSRTDGAPGFCDPPLAIEPSPYLHTAETLEQLAEPMGIAPLALADTVARFNNGANRGVDEDFGRGTDDFSLFHADSDAANPALPPLTKAPYFAVRLVLSDLGTKGGAVTDANARVLDRSGKPIGGLFAAGGSAASVAGHVYPGPGTPLGSGMVFAYRAMRSVIAGDTAAQPTTAR